MSNYLRLKKMLYIVMLTAVTIVLSLIQPTNIILTGPWSAFVKLDFSDIVVLVAFIVLGFKETFVVILLRALIRPLIFPQMGLMMDYIGEMLALIASFSIIFAYIFAQKIYNKKEKPLLYVLPVQDEKLSIKQWIVYLSTSVLFLSVIMLFANFLIFTPLYLSLFGATLSATSIHFSVFTYVKESIPPFTLLTFFWATLVSYTPFNIVKALIITSIFLLIKPRIKYLDL